MHFYSIFYTRYNVEKVLEVMHQIVSRNKTEQEKMHGYGSYKFIFQHVDKIYIYLQIILRRYLSTANNSN
jgi:hypothetical protein